MARRNPPATRRILYHPSYGGGWVSARYKAPRAERQFMLDYAPFIAHISRGGRLGWRRPQFFLDPMPAAGKFNAWLRDQQDPGNTLLREFIDAWTRRFRTHVPWEAFWALDGLRVEEVPADALVRITAHDGAETVETVTTIDPEEWL